MSALGRIGERSAMRLILVRHGQTPSNVAGLLDTELPGAALTERGRQQAQDLVQALAPERIGQLHASAALRAQQTIAPLAQSRSLPVRVHPELKEVAAGDWEMAGDEDSVRGYLSTIGRWMTGELDLATPGPAGETGHTVLDRFDTAIDRIASSDEPAVLVAHGAVIRFWVARRTLDLPPGFMLDHGLHNTGYLVVDGDPDAGWLLQSWAAAAPGAARPSAGIADGPADEDMPPRD